MGIGELSMETAQDRKANHGDLGTIIPHREGQAMEELSPKKNRESVSRKELSVESNQIIK